MRIVSLTHRRIFPNGTRPSRGVLAFAACLVAGLLGLACQPSIGDRCNLSTDCSARGDRLCDKSQGDDGRGYCTVFNCNGNGCPDEAACVVFGSSVPGCGFVDRGISRSARSFCMKTCAADQDCRSDEGYVCRGIVRPGVATSSSTIEGVILDDDQTKRVCVYVGLVKNAAGALEPVALPPLATQPDAAVCQSQGPAVDASAFQPTDASSKDATTKDAATDGSPNDGGVVDSGPTDASGGG